MVKQTIPNNGIQNAVGNNVYPDLVLTRYPDYFDERSGSKENKNMYRWKNLEDFNMAEHVNALSDAIMALQRALGEVPQIATVPKDANGQIITDPAALLALKKIKTVKSRLDDLENKNFDKRYGGPNWKPDTGNTIEEHKHLGQLGGASKIDLTKEVQNKLPKQNVDLSQTTNGLTGADIFINSTVKVTIDASVGDKLSMSEGGTIKKNLSVEGKTNTRWHREYDVNDLSGTKTADNGTMLNACVTASGLPEFVFLSKKFTNLYYGRYVMIVRAKSNKRVTGNILQLSTVAKSGDSSEVMTVKGTDFKAANQWQTFYLALKHEPNTTSGEGELRVKKLTTAEDVTISLDYVLLTPIHPGVFDY